MVPRRDHLLPEQLSKGCVSVQLRRSGKYARSKSASSKDCVKKITNRLVRVKLRFWQIAATGRGVRHLVETAASARQYISLA